MSDLQPFSDNPYDSPSTPTIDVGKTSGNIRTVETLRATRPWVMFLAILGFIGSALMVLGGIVGGLAVISSNPAGLLMIVVYLVLGLVYLLPSVYLYRYASRIGLYVRDRSERSLNEALTAQMSFWRLVGIITLVMIVLYLGLIILVVVASVSVIPSMR